MRKLIIFSMGIMMALSLLSQHAAAQGFTGKRVLFHYNNSFMKAIDGSQLYNSKNIPPALQFTGSHFIGTEVVFNRRKSLLLSYNTFRTGGDYLLSRSSGVALGIRSYRYRKGAIAPLGNYGEWRFTMLGTKSVDRETRRENYQSSLLMVTWGFGRQTALYKSMFINYGMEFSFPIDLNSSRHDVFSDVFLNNWITFKLGVSLASF